jgi:CBS domain-containing protein
MLWLEGEKIVAVVRNDRVAGFVTAEDLTAGPGGTRGDDDRLAVETFIGAAHPFLSWEDDRETALDLMTRLGLSRLPVVGHRGRPWGIIRLNDLLLQDEPAPGGDTSTTRSGRATERSLRTRVG